MYQKSTFWCVLCYMSRRKLTAKQESVIVFTDLIYHTKTACGDDGACFSSRSSDFSHNTVILFSGFLLFQHNLRFSRNTQRRPARHRLGGCGCCQRHYDHCFGEYFDVTWFQLFPVSWFWSRSTCDGPFLSNEIVQRWWIISASFRTLVGQFVVGVFELSLPAM